MTSHQGVGPTADVRREETQEVEARTRPQSPAGQGGIDELKSRLGALARSLRRCDLGEGLDLRRPQQSEDDLFHFQGQLLERKRIVLLSRGCSVATCTMCPLPNEAITADRPSPSVQDLIEQFEAAFTKRPLDAYGMVTIYSNGNFFADAELPPPFREHVLRRLGRSTVRALVIESLPGFVSRAKLETAHSLLGGVQLVVSMGLESSDDEVRELCVNNRCTLTGFERAVALLRRVGYLPRVFLSIKPPFLSEREAIEDAVRSMAYLAQLGISDPTLCPTRVAPNTVVSALSSLGLYTPPWLWTVQEIVSSVAGLSAPRIATSSLWPERNPGSTVPSNCECCSASKVRRFERYNASMERADLELDCTCRSEYLVHMNEDDATWGQLSLPDRVRRFLDRVGEAPQLPLASR